MLRITKKLGPSILFACFLGGCAAHDSVEDRARSAMELVLKDPDTAKFSDVTEQNSVICGFVNSKNSMGGYEGFRAFLVKDGTPSLDSWEAEPQFGKLFDQYCPVEARGKQLQLMSLESAARVREDVHALNR